ncbi:MAG: cyclic nucleotide-binding domain-containing protein, partial [Hyphomicrobiales bacterium]|nr:cyclic nucleotide-binding domain-containing protein [Hyphomicrobiales bacterium]
MRGFDRQALTRLGLFAGCSQTTANELLARARVQSYPPHAEIVREGEAADHLHVLLSGLVQIVAHDNGHETTISILEPPNAFIMAAVYLDRPYLQAARTLEICTVLLIDAEPIRRMAKTDIALSNNIAHELAHAYRMAAQELKNQKLRPGLQRLANWLLRHDVEAGGGGKFSIPYDKKVLAARLGMAPEVLSRSFATLAKYDVAVHGREVEIRDIKALMRLARPSPLI